MGVSAKPAAEEALQCIQSALDELTEIGAPEDILLHLDDALNRLKSALGSRSSKATPESSST